MPKELQEHRNYLAMCLIVTIATCIAIQVQTCTGTKTMNPLCRKSEFERDVFEASMSFGRSRQFLIRKFYGDSDADAILNDAGELYSGTQTNARHPTDMMQQTAMAIAVAHVLCPPLHLH